jgi:hypothetical protein
MRRHYYQPQPMLRRSEMLRLMSMLLLLAVLFTLISRLRTNPQMLAWMLREEGDKQYVRHAPPAPDAKPPAGAPQSAKPSGAPAENSAGPADKTEAEPAAAEPKEVPPDQDPEEADALKEELQAVSDGQMYRDRTEMAAYHRLARWAKAQTFEAMSKRATKNVVYTRYLQSPSEMRGKLVAMRLDVRRILEGSPVTDPEDTTRKITFYELWGFTDESKTFPYCVIAEDMPEGMPIAPNVQEYVRFVGYFLGLQGYQSALSKPGSRPLVAPMLIGRVKWDKPEPMPLTNTDYSIIAIVAAAVVLIAIGAFAVAILRGRRGFLETANRSNPGALSVDDWLDRAQQGDAPADPTAADDDPGPPPRV